jgi:hypothetical protein
MAKTPRPCMYRSPSNPRPRRAKEVRVQRASSSFRCPRRHHASPDVHKFLEAMLGTKLLALF